MTDVLSRHDKENDDGYFFARIRLAWADMELTRAGFGAWAIGTGGWAYAWRWQDDNTEAIAAVRAAGAGTGPASPPLAAPPRY